ELVGVGLSVYVEPSALGWERGLVRIEADGRATAATGSSADGQGHETVFAQIVADRLGLEPEAIDVRHGDTDVIPTGIGTFGSRSTALGGNALAHAADAVVAAARRPAAHPLGAHADDVPHAEIHHMHSPTKRNPLGAKGLGEAGNIGVPPAVVNAVVDALSPFGVRHLDMPLTPESIWRAFGRGVRRGVAISGPPL